MKITGASALVTGAASGLGAATAKALAAAGARVTGLDLSSQIETADPNSGVALVAADVTSENDVNDVLSTVTTAGPLRIVVNCAGIAPAQRILSAKGSHDLDLFRKVLEVNTVGTFNSMRLAANVISQQDPDEYGQRGVLINTASVAAYEGQVGQIAYSASKGAVISMTLTAARDLARYGIRVNTIAPGIVDTPMLASLPESVRSSLSAKIPFPQRLARPDEYAQLAISLIEHDYINGEVIRMDGALRMDPK